MADFLERQIQRVRATVLDHILEPDAMRGSEVYLTNITDADGKNIQPVDEELARRNAQMEALATRSPLRMTSGGSQTPADQITPASVTTRPSTPFTDPQDPRSMPGFEAWAKANGWSPPQQDSGKTDTAATVEPPVTSSTLSPVPNAEGSQSAPQTAPPPSPASAP